MKLGKKSVLQSRIIHLPTCKKREIQILATAKGGNLATWRWSFSFRVLKPRCQVSVLVWFHGC